MIDVEITAEAFEGHTIVAVSMGGSLSPSDELDVIGVYDSEDSIVVRLGTKSLAVGAA